MSWDDVLAAWDDARVHDAYVADAQLRGAFGEAATRYREILKQRPGDAIAEKRLEQVKKLAMAMLLTRPPAPPKTPSPWRLIVLFLAFVALLVLGVYWLVHDAKKQRARPRPPPTPGQLY